MMKYKAFFKFEVFYYEILWEKNTFYFLLTGTGFNKNINKNTSGVSNK